MKNLYWKEFREVRTIALLCLVTCVILTFFYGLYGAFILLIPMSLILGGDALAREKHTADFLLTKPVSRNTIFTTKIVTSIAALAVVLAAAGLILLVGAWYRAHFGTAHVQNVYGYREYIPYFFSGDKKFIPGAEWIAFDLLLIIALFSSALFVSTFGLDSTTSLVAGAVLLGACDLLLTGIMRYREMKIHSYYADPTIVTAIMVLNTLCMFLFICLAWFVFTKREKRR